MEKLRQKKTGEVACRWPSTSPTSVHHPHWLPGSMQAHTGRSGDSSAGLSRVWWWSKGGGGGRGGGQRQWHKASVSHGWRWLADRPLPLPRGAGLSSEPRPGTNLRLPTRALRRWEQETWWVGTKRGSLMHPKQRVREIVSNPLCAPFLLLPPTSHNTGAGGAE